MHYWGDNPTVGDTFVRSANANASHSRGGAATRYSMRRDDDTTARRAMQRAVAEAYTSMQRRANANHSQRGALPQYSIERRDSRSEADANRYLVASTRKARR